MNLYFMISTLVITMGFPQRLNGQEYPRRCTNRPGISNCHAPRACQTGRYENTVNYFPGWYRYCCYKIEGPYGYTDYRYQPGEWSLDCRKRDVTNFGRTDTSPKVVDLDLSFNSLRGLSSSLRDDFLNHFTNLKTLKLEQSGLDNLPADFLSAHAELETALFSWNDITTLPKQLFANNTKLIDLDLRDNRITNIPDDIFKNNRNLERLQISGNFITQLTSKLLRHLPKLAAFDASYNDRLECISPDLFRHNPKLYWVRLTDIGPIITRNIQKTYCNSRAECPYSINRLKSAMRTYGYFYRCPGDENTLGIPNRGYPARNTYYRYRNRRPTHATRSRGRGTSR